MNYIKNNEIDLSDSIQHSSSYIADLSADPYHVDYEKFKKIYENFKTKPICKVEKKDGTTETQPHVLELFDKMKITYGNGTLYFDDVADEFIYEDDDFSENIKDSKFFSFDGSLVLFLLRFDIERKILDYYTETEYNFFNNISHSYKYIDDNNKIIELKAINDEGITGFYQKNSIYDLTKGDKLIYNGRTLLKREDTKISADFRFIFSYDSEEKTFINIIKNDETLPEDEKNRINNCLQYLYILYDENGRTSPIALPVSKNKIVVYEVDTSKATDGTELDPTKIIYTAKLTIDNEYSFQNGENNILFCYDYRIYDSSNNIKAVLVFENNKSIFYNYFDSFPNKEISIFRDDNLEILKKTDGCFYEVKHFYENSKILKITNLSGEDIKKYYVIKFETINNIVKGVLKHFQIFDNKEEIKYNSYSYLYYYDNFGKYFVEKEYGNDPEKLFETLSNEFLKNYNYSIKTYGNFYQFLNNHINSEILENLRSDNIIYNGSTYQYYNTDIIHGMFQKKPITYSETLQINKQSFKYDNTTKKWLNKLIFSNGLKKLFYQKNNKTIADWYFAKNNAELLSYFIDESIGEICFEKNLSEFNFDNFKWNFDSDEVQKTLINFFIFYIPIENKRKLFTIYDVDGIKRSVFLGRRENDSSVYLITTDFIPQIFKISYIDVVSSGKFLNYSIKKENNKYFLYKEYKFSSNQRFIYDASSNKIELSNEGDLFDGEAFYVELPTGLYKLNNGEKLKYSQTTKKLTKPYFEEVYNNTNSQFMFHPDDYFRSHKEVYDVFYKKIFNKYSPVDKYSTNSLISQIDLFVFSKEFTKNLSNNRPYNFEMPFIQDNIRKPKFFENKNTNNLVFEMLRGTTNTLMENNVGDYLSKIINKNIQKLETEKENLESISIDGFMNNIRNLGAAIINDNINNSERYTADFEINGISAFPKYFKNLQQSINIVGSSIYNLFTTFFSDINDNGANGFSLYNVYQEMKDIVYYSGPNNSVITISSFETLEFIKIFILLSKFFNEGITESLKNNITQFYNDINVFRKHYQYLEDLVNEYNNSISDHKFNFYNFRFFENEGD